jgi:hypothetical protein
MIEIRAATTPTELMEVYRFRYRVYVEELGRAGYYADHRRKILTDPLDETGTVLAAWDEGQVVGTIRGNSPAESDLGFHTTLCQMQKVGSFYPHQTSFCSKFMIEKAYRQTTLPIRLAMAFYRLGRQHGVEFNFHSGPAYTVPFYTKLGFRRYQEEVEHPEYGRTTTMILVLSDIDYFKRIKSPLWRVAREYPLNPDAVDYYYRNFRPDQVAIAAGS